MREYFDSQFLDSLQLPSGERWSNALQENSSSSIFSVRGLKAGLLTVSYFHYCGGYAISAVCLCAGLVLKIL